MYQESTSERNEKNMMMDIYTEMDWVIVRNEIKWSGRLVYFTKISLQQLKMAVSTLHGLSASMHAWKHNVMLLMR